MRDDTPHTREVIDWAQRERLPIHRPGPYHLKIGPWNYFPTKQAFNSDNAVKVRMLGFEEFKLAVKRWLHDAPGAAETTAPDDTQEIVVELDLPSGSDHPNE